MVLYTLICKPQPIFSLLFPFPSSPFSLCLHHRMTTSSGKFVNKALGISILWHEGNRQSWARSRKVGSSHMKRARVWRKAVWALKHKGLQHTSSIATASAHNIALQQVRVFVLLFSPSSFRSFPFYIFLPIVFHYWPLLHIHNSYSIPFYPHLL